MMNDVTDTSPQPEAEELHPGLRLKQAREAQGLTREQVAAELRLHPKLVAAIEENDQERLPPATFVAGYLRSYARLLGLPAEAIVARYEQLKAAPPRLVSRSRPAQVTSQDLPVRLFTWVVLIGLLILAGLWWVSQRPAHDVGPEPSAPVGQAAPDASLPLLLPPAVDVAPDPQAPAAAPSPQPEAAPSQTPAAGAEVPASAPAVAPAAPATQAAAPESVPAGPLVTLRLVYEADSWTEVEDATGRKLVFDLIRAGRDLSVAGQPPLRVFLGYSPGVTVYVGDERFDHKRFQRRDLARFTVEG